MLLCIIVFHLQFSCAHAWNPVLVTFFRVNRSIFRWAQSNSFIPCLAHQNAQLGGTLELSATGIVQALASSLKLQTEISIQSVSNLTAKCTANPALHLCAHPEPKNTRSLESWSFLIRSNTGISCVKLLEVYKGIRHFANKQGFKSHCLPSGSTQTISY